MLPDTVTDVRAAADSFHHLEKDHHQGQTMRPRTTFFDGFLPEEDEAMRVAFDLFRRGKTERGIDIARLLYGGYDPALAMMAEAMILLDRLTEIETLRRARMRWPRMSR